MTPTAPIGRPGLTPAENIRRAQAINATLLSPAPCLKAAAAELGLHVDTVAKHAHSIGWRTMWVTDEERAHLLGRRQPAAHRAA